jgi:signal transduction histidine kinase
MLIDSSAPVEPPPAARHSRPIPTKDRLRCLQRLAMQGELAATAVHEISNLQTIVLFNAGLLRERRRDDPEILRYIDPLLHAAKMVASLCSQLRNLAHPVEARSRVMDLGETSQGTFTLLEQIIGRKLAFERTAPAPLFTVADSAQVEQILINLVLNSRDATSPDTGRIVVRLGRERGTRRPWLEVEDNGTGMTAQVKSRLFTKFFTTKPPGHGTGLGLATVQRLLESMGGRIAVYSRVGRGTRIRLVFSRPSSRLVSEYLALATAFKPPSLHAQSSPA